MSDLRNRIIRLAHSNPSLRKDLLPLLKEGNHQKNSFDVRMSKDEKLFVQKILNSKAGMAFGLSFKSFSVNYGKFDDDLRKRTYKFETNYDHTHQYDWGSNAVKEHLFVVVGIDKRRGQIKEEYYVQTEEAELEETYKSEKSFLSKLPRFLANSKSISLPMQKLGGRDDQWFNDEDFRRRKYYEVRDAVLKDIRLFLKTNAKELVLYQKAYESALTLHNATTNRLIKDHIESTVLIDGLRHAYEFGFKKDKEQLEASVSSITQMIEKAFELGPMAGFVPDKYEGDRSFPLHPKVSRSLNYHRQQVVKNFYK